MGNEKSDLKKNGSVKNLVNFFTASYGHSLGRIFSVFRNFDFEGGGNFFSKKMEKKMEIFLKKLLKILLSRILAIGQRQKIRNELN